MKFQEPPVGILGAGISGLSAAYALNKQGIPVTVYEKSDEVGGVIKSHQKGGWLVESGPNTMMVRDQKVWDLLDELELTDHIVEANKAAKKRFIVRNGRLCPLPSSLPKFLATKLLSTSAKLRLLKEPFVSTSTKDDEPIAHFIKRRLGREVLDSGGNPFVTGIYAGDPGQLSVKYTFEWLHELEQKHGSLTRGLFKQQKDKTKTPKALLSFDEGLQVLPLRLQQELGDELKPRTKVNAISKNDNGW